MQYLNRSVLTCQPARASLRMKGSPRPSPLITLITFAPVQGFISSSRKLRDLYGSSLLLSYLAKAIMGDAEQRLGIGAVVSPALVSTSRGTPNLLVIQGDYRQGHGRDALRQAWFAVLEGCRTWLEQEFQSHFVFDWANAWNQARLHSWEYFHAQGPTISEARARMRLAKQARNWQAINWTGESSSLSGAEAVVWPEMGAVIDPRNLEHQQKIDQLSRRFAATLATHDQLGEAFISISEQLSLNELVKRLVTYRPVAERAFAGESFADLGPENFKDLADAGRVVWFMADGDSIGSYLHRLTQSGKGDEVTALRSFSAAMRRWAASLYATVPEAMHNKATVIYAGGDDLLGALHDVPGIRPSDPPRKALDPADLWCWLELFPSTIWPRHQQHGLTVSMGLVWCQGGIPQRQALAQVRLAEKAAKKAGRNRFALRLLFRNGQHLEWICPWLLLPQLRYAFRDREQRRGEDALWRHLSDDLEWLAGRGALSHATALALWQTYFSDRLPPPASHHSSELTTSNTIHQPLAEWMQAMARTMASLSSSRANDPLLPSRR